VQSACCRRIRLKSFPPALPTMTVVRARYPQVAESPHNGLRRRDSTPFWQRYCPPLALAARFSPPRMVDRPFCALSAGLPRRRRHTALLPIGHKLVQRCGTALAPPALPSRPLCPLCRASARPSAGTRMTTDFSTPQDRSRDLLGARQPSWALSSPTPRDARASARLVGAGGCGEERGRSVTRLVA